MYLDILNCLLENETKKLKENKKRILISIFIYLLKFGEVNIQYAMCDNIISVGVYVKDKKI